MRNYILLFITGLLLQACTSPEKKIPAADTVSGKSRAVTIINKTPIDFKGLYTFGNEVNTFQECGLKKVYWVNDSLADIRKSYEEASKFMTYPYESVYAEVKGYLSGKSHLGYASEYENVLVITEITRLEPKNFRTDCYNYEFIALGNEPFWSLDIIPSEKRIVLKEVGEEKVTEFLYSPANLSGGLYRYTATNPKNEKIEVLIRKEKCSDGMSDRQYNYSAEIRLNGRILKGCAIKKGEIFNDRP